MKIVSPQTKLMAASPVNNTCSRSAPAKARPSGQTVFGVVNPPAAQSAGRAFQSKRRQTVFRRSVLVQASATTSDDPNGVSRKVFLLQPVTVRPAAQRPLLVYIPGTDGTGSSIAPQLPGLINAGFDVRALYIPLTDRSNWEQLTEELLSLIKAAQQQQQQKHLGDSQDKQFGQITLVGESFGGCLALRVAAKAPELIERLVLLNPATSFRRSYGGISSLIAQTNLLSLFPERLYQVAQAVLVPLLVEREKLVPATLPTIKSMMVMSPPPQYQAQEGYVATERPRWQQWHFPGLPYYLPAQTASWRLFLMTTGNLPDKVVASIRVPTLLIGAGRDRLLPSLSEVTRLQRLLPDARRMILPTSGHTPLLEASVDLASILRRASFLPAVLATATATASDPVSGKETSFRTATAGGVDSTASGSLADTGPGRGQIGAGPAGRALRAEDLAGASAEIGVIGAVSVVPLASNGAANGSGSSCRAGGVGLAELVRAEQREVPADAGDEVAAVSLRPNALTAELDPIHGINVVAPSGRDDGAAAASGQGGNGNGNGTAGYGAAETVWHGREAAMRDSSANGAALAGPEDGEAASIATRANGAASSGGSGGPPDTQPGQTQAVSGAGRQRPASAAERAIPFPAARGGTWSNVEESWENTFNSLGLWRTLTAPLVLGEDNLPDPMGVARPVLFVGNHTRFGLYDLPPLMAELYTRGYAARGLAHPSHWQTPLGAFFERFGAVKASPLAAYKLLQKGEAVLLFPGGGREVNKRKGQEYQLLWRDTPDFVRMAAKTKAIIVPFAVVGGDDAYELFLDNRELLANPLIGPLALALFSRFAPELDPEEALPPITKLPGLGLPSLLPIPKLERLYFKIQPPIDTVKALPDLKDMDAAMDVYNQVRRSVCDGLQELQEVRAQDPGRSLPNRLLAAAAKYAPAFDLVGEIPH